MIRALLAALLMLVFGASPVCADELRPGYLELTERAPGDWLMIWKAPIRGGLATQAVPRLPGFCRLAPASREVRGGALVVVTRAQCRHPLAGSAIALAGIDTTFTDALVRIAPFQAAVQVARLTPDAAAVRVSARPGRLEVVRTYFLLGIGHILTGYDHLLFVLALVLLLRRLGTVAKAVTAFTVAHSITLVGSTLGFLGLPQAPVESVIALSIMFLAVEIVKADAGNPRLSQRVPWIVAFVFGLLHGFGFAGALAEIGLPQGEVPAALLMFNLGVEAGQLMIVSAGLAALFAIRKAAGALQHAATVAAAYAIGITASYWFIARTLG